jgi:hypothetical protein
MKAIAAAVASVAATTLCPMALAQESALSESEVQGFVDAMTEESHRIVAEGAWDDLRGWVERHVAEEARVVASGALVGAGGPAIQYNLVADRENLLLLGGMMMAGPHGLGAIQDYSLTSAVGNVTLLPSGEAVASVRFHEPGAVELPAGTGGEAPPAMSFHSTADCDLRLQKSGGEVRITVATCEATSTM